MLQLAVVDRDAVMAVSSRPSRDSHDRLLYGKQFCDMEFICLRGRDCHHIQVNGWLYLDSNHSETASDGHPNIHIQFYSF